MRFVGSEVGVGDGEGEGGREGDWREEGWREMVGKVARTGVRRKKRRERRERVVVEELGVGDMVRLGLSLGMR